MYWKDIPQSKIHEKFSEWHKKHCKKNATLTDADRIWFQIRTGQPKAVFDLKYPKTDPGLTYSEKVLYQWFEEKGVPCYIIEMAGDEGPFNVKRLNWECAFSSEEMAIWIDFDLPELPPKSNNFYPESLWKAIYGISS
jgi:hypothetical protein